MHLKALILFAWAEIDRLQGCVIYLGGFKNYDFGFAKIIVFRKKIRSQKGTDFNIA